MFYQDNKSICASLPVFPSFWVESEATMRSFLQFHNQSSGTLWLSLIGRSFSPPQLYFVAWSSERNLSSPSYYPGLASFPFIGMDYFINDQLSQLMIRHCNTITMWWTTTSGCLVREGRLLMSSWTSIMQPLTFITLSSVFFASSLWRRMKKRKPAVL